MNESTLLQRLLYTTLEAQEKESVLGKYIQTILPGLEREFALVTAMGGIKGSFAKLADQSLLVHVLNGLIVAWNLHKKLDEELSEIEEKLLCLGFTLHDYDKYFFSKGEESPSAHQTSEIIQRCHELAIKLNFQYFWDEWEIYQADICYLAQNTQGKRGSNLHPPNWEKTGHKLQLSAYELGKLCDLLAFADIAVHIQNPGDIRIDIPTTRNRGKVLTKYLDDLGIDAKLVYHRLRDSRGVLTNYIHNAFVKFAEKLNWQPILFFANGVVYLAPKDTLSPQLSDIQQEVWHTILQGINDKKQKLDGLESYFLKGDVGFIRGGKGVKIAPLTREIFTPAQLICQLPDVVKENVRNLKSIATSKRLDKIALTPDERKKLESGVDIWADRLAEFIILIQKEFFIGNDDFIAWVLNTLKINSYISIEQTKFQVGGVNYGWYQAAANFVVRTNLDRHPDSEEFLEVFKNFAVDLSNWAEKNSLLPSHTSPTYEAFCEYLNQYLEVFASEHNRVNFVNELAGYVNSKVKNKPICSISSGEFAAEDQLESVVIFKPQQYSNKNLLGGRRIKRGISKVWALEMILRQAYWKATSGKFEERQPVFLYIYPAYLYSPQVARAIGIFVDKLHNLELKEVCNQWTNANLEFWGLQSLPWTGKASKAGEYKDTYYVKFLPFVAICPLTTGEKTFTDAWVKPAFIALALPMLLGVKVVATTNLEPLYASDSEFLESVRLDNPAGFWNLLGLSLNLRLPELKTALQRLLITYKVHLDAKSLPRDERWRSLSSSVREITTNVLNIFRLVKEGLRRNKRDNPTDEQVQQYWKLARIWVGDDEDNSKNQNAKLSLSKQEFKTNNTGKELMDSITRLVQEYRVFYQTSLSDSSYSILLPVSKVLEVILKVPEEVVKVDEVLIFQCAGQLRDALERQDVYKRPLMMNKKLDYPTRQAKELEAIHTFVTTCVNELFHKFYKSDRALLQENINRIKSGAEFAYRMLALKEKTETQGAKS